MILQCGLFRCEGPIVVRIVMLSLNPNLFADHTSNQIMPVSKTKAFHSLIVHLS